MRKHKKTIIFSIVAVVVLTGGLVGGILATDQVFADDGNPGKGRRGALLTRTAQILGVDQTDLENAFKQANKELRTEALEAKLQEFVSSGKITQAQADEFMDWINLRPDVPANNPRILQKLVDEGKLTQQQLDDFNAWLEDKPDIPELDEAFKQDRMERREAALDTWLQKLIDNDKITPEQADEFTQWLDARPDLPSMNPKVLKALLDEGQITQEQFDEYKEWLQAKPDIPLPKPKRPGGPRVPFK
jgi:hypothetical protein